MWNSNSEPDLLLAQTINRRLGVESIVERGKSFLVVCIVIGLCAIIVSGGLYIFSRGLRQGIDIESEAHSIASAFSKALENVVLRAETSGTVSLETTPLLISPNSQVKLDPLAETKIAPGSTVSVAANFKFANPRPSENQLGLNQKGLDGAVPFTEYVLFHSVPFGKGEVESRWTYDVDKQSSPKTQVCVYREIIGQGKVLSFGIAANGVRRSDDGLARHGLKIDQVLPLCKWTNL